MPEQESLAVGVVLERRYEIVGLLGAGGFGRVYRAIDRGRLGEPCVVKELVPRSWGGDRARHYARFEREARTLLRLHHPRIPRLHAFFEVDERFFLVQDLVEGSTVQQILETRGSLGEAAVRDVIGQVLEILEYLHRHEPPIVHRDIKPSNLILDASGSIYLIDFGGIFEALEGGHASEVVARVGTPGYAPFEQVMGRVVPASDLYALGASAITLLTGQQPLTWLGRHDDSWALDGNTGASRLLEQFIGRLVADLPGRFATASEARVALSALPAVPAPSIATASLPRPAEDTPSVALRASLGRRRGWTTKVAEQFPSIREKLVRGAFDVFLSYNRTDRDAVYEVAVSLQLDGVLPWFDEWDFRPGDDWMRALEELIPTIRVAAVFVGPSGLGPWQEEEMRAFLQEIVGRRGRIIPVLLPGAPEQPVLPLFLRTRTWVDLRRDREIALARLAWGIIDEPPRTTP